MDAVSSGGAAGSGEPPRGRRGNGLRSADWGALVDLDPRLSGALLDRLAAAGVAAYVEPAGGTSDPLSRASLLPGRPLDRLWVDPVRADAAREVVGTEVSELGALLSEQEPGATAHGFVQPVPRGAAPRILPPPLLPDPPPAATPAADVPDPATTGAPPQKAGAPASSAADDALDTDAQWRAIVEGFGRTPEGPVAPWPVAEDVDPPSRRLPASDQPRPLRRRADPTPDDALPAWVQPAALPDEHGYEPPPPPPVPRLQPRTVGAWAAVLLGTVVLFLPHLLDLSPGAGTTLLGMLLTAGGAGALVWWMRDAPGRDDDPDDGAVV